MVYPALEDEYIKMLELDHSFDHLFVAKFLDFMEANFPFLLKEWVKKVLHYNPQIYIHKDHQDFPKLIKHTQYILTLLLKYLKSPNDYASLHTFTRQLAQEKLVEQVKLEEFIHIMNQGHITISHFISGSTLGKDEQIQSLLLINNFYNLLIYCLVTQYSLQREALLQDKNKFIQDMHMDRLSIIGQIAASFAHEFRNPLTSIKGFIYLLEEEYRKEGKRKHYFGMINREMKRLQEIVNQFLLLSKVKGMEDHPEKVNLTNLIHGVIEFMYPRFLEADIQVKAQVMENMQLYAVKDQIEQVILNIINNAVEELSKHKSPRIITVIGKQTAQHVEISIANNGPQIPSHLLETLFQPFVTTKELGIGLGLSVCKQIVEKHQGQIYVSTNSEKTSFHLCFPFEKRNC